MVLNIIQREIRHHILSLRLHITLLLTLTIFGLGTIAFVKSHSEEQAEYTKYHTEFIEQSRKAAESNLTKLAVKRQNLVLEPRGDAFITDSKEKYLPNRFDFSGYNVFGFDIRPGSANPYLNTFQELNWVFIVSIIISFTVLLFTFDTVSGEKEAKTLAATLSNPVSRGALLFGKYLSMIITTLLVLAPGMALSLIILLISGAVAITPVVAGEIIGFLVSVFFLVACIAAFGILSSVLTRNANISLLVALTLWLVFVVIVPNTAVFWARRLFPIEKVETVWERISREREEINRNAPKGSWSSSGDNPFLPQHELRANNQTNLMNSQMKILNAYYGEMFRQYERARMLTFLSPLSVFEYMSEAVVGGGYVRFQKVWRDLHAWQTQFLAYFKEVDAKDPDSPHWYNPFEDYSTTRKGVSFEQVPVFKEKSLPLRERISYASLYLLITVLYTALAFVLSFVLFLRYDVR